MNDDKQTRHEKLIEFLSQFSQYHTEKGPRLQKVKRTRLSPDIDKIDSNDINQAVIVFTDALNIGSGSSGAVAFDLYTLLQAYLRVPACRDKLNQLAMETLAYKKQAINRT